MLSLILPADRLSTPALFRRDIGSAARLRTLNGPADFASGVRENTRHKSLLAGPLRTNRHLLQLCVHGGTGGDLKKLSTLDL